MAEQRGLQQKAEAALAAARAQAAPPLTLALLLAPTLTLAQA